MSGSAVTPSVEVGFGAESWEALAGPLGPALAAARIGVWRVHVPTMTGTWDRVTSEILGRSPRPQESPVALPIHPEDREKAFAWLRRAAAGQGDPIVCVRLATASGEVRWVRAIARPPSCSSATGEWLIGILGDVTAELTAEAELRDSQRQLAMLVDHLPGMAYRCEVAAPWRMQYASTGAETLTGYPAADFTGGGRSWADLMHADDVDEVGGTVANAVATGASFEISYRVITRNGLLRWVQERGRAVCDESGTPQVLEGFIWDISDAKAAVADAHWIANHDPLTGLPNRLLFQEALEARAGKRDSSGYAVLLLDLDDFKRTNDTLGHDTGDALLVEFSRRLKTTLRDGDLVARLGGDEFAIILDAIDGESAVIQAGNGIFEALNAPFEHSAGLLACSVSIGASICPQHGNCRTEMLKHADIALYAAKAAGRGNLKVFRRTMRAELTQRSTMLSVARQALVSDSIVPVYQPKVHLKSDRVDGFEALLRWRSGTGSLRPPRELSAAFDDPVLATQLGTAMTVSVIRDIRDWLQAGVSFGHVALNVSAAQFRRGDLADCLLERLRAADVPPECLQVEVTETVFLGRGARHVERALCDLAASGVRIALDDFGTGYASLIHLAQFPVSTLKIDRSFVEKMLGSDQDSAIIRAVINLGHSLGMSVVAEGVETAAQEAKLRVQDCDFAQGFLYAQAMRAQDVARLSRNEPVRRRA